jgi:nucleoside-diphosphate-sugar epimerase
VENKLEAAARDGVRCLIVRFGDFFGPRPGNNWFSQGMVKPHGPVKSISYPGGKSIGHAWAYLPDAGETFAPLMDLQRICRILPDFISAAPGTQTEHR